jgi:hypothetical protein
LERVRLFVNHLGNGFSDLLRYWMDMSRQFFTKEMIIRIVGDDGKTLFPLIQKTDLEGNFDYKALVLPSIAGQQDIKKKQDMDLFQLLINLPFVDPQKLTQKILVDWNWSIDSVSKGSEQPEPAVGPDGQPMMGPDGQPLPASEPAPGPQTSPDVPTPPVGTTNIPSNVAQNALALLRGGAGNAPAAPFAQASSPVNLLAAGGMPPTAGGVATRVALPTTNPRGLNRGGKVNTNISTHGVNSNPESALMNRASSLQKGK